MATADFCIIDGAKEKGREIQAASGEWMNKLVTSKRNNTKVYVPAADIIKRTIRRSWTISNPTPAPRWSAVRGSPELRLYNSFPRGQDIANYPTLALHQAQLTTSTDAENPIRNSRSPTRRTQSEDVYSERNEAVCSTNTSSYERSSDKTRINSPVHQSNSPESFKRPVRVNPLMQLASNKENKDRRQSPKRKSQLYHGNKDAELSGSSTEKIDKSENPSPLRHSSDDERSSQEKPIEKHVSFDYSQRTSDFLARSRSLSQGKPKGRKMPVTSRSLPEEAEERDESLLEQNNKEESNPVELCDIEPLSGTVFRKMTVRRRRQENMRKMAAVDAGWRRTPDAELFDFLLPDGEDWRLVFVSNSDSSSKEEDDIDSSSASSFPIDECDWDYFEPGARTQPLIGWGSPFGSPRVYRKRLIDSPLGSPLVRRRRVIRESSDDDCNSTSSPSEALFSPQPPLGNHSVPLYYKEHHSAVVPPYNFEASHTGNAVPPYNFETSKAENPATLETKEPYDAPLGGTPPASRTRDDSHGCVHRHRRNDSVNSTVSFESPAGAQSGISSGISGSSCSNCGCTASTTHRPQFIPIPVPVPIPFPVPWNVAQLGNTSWNDLSAATLSPFVLYKTPPQRNDWWKYLAQVPPYVWPLLSGNGTPMINEEIPLAQELFGTANDKTGENGDQNEKKSEGEVVENNPDKILEKDADLSDSDSVENDDSDDEEPSGHLECENIPPEDQQSSTSSDSSNDDAQNDDVDHPRVRRVYNVSGHPDDRESDDALPSSNVSSDDEELDENRSSPNEHEDSYSSSGSADTDSNDTGTVADQKPKKFSRVFVVNHKGANSSSSEDESSSSNDEDTSDNDTDTELDCTVILRYVKQLDSEEICAENENQEHDNTLDDGSLKLIGVKYLDNEFNPSKENDNLNDENDNNGVNCDKIKESATKDEKESSASTSGKKLVCDNKFERKNRKGKPKYIKGNKKNKEIIKTEKKFEEKTCKHIETEKEGNLVASDSHETIVKLSSNQICIKKETNKFIEEEIKHLEFDGANKKQKNNEKSSSNIVKEDCDKVVKKDNLEENNVAQETTSKVNNDKPVTNEEKPNTENQSESRNTESKEEKAEQTSDQTDKNDILSDELELLELKPTLFTHINSSSLNRDSLRAPNSSPTLSIESDSLEPLSEAQGITQALNLKLSDIFNKLSELDQENQNERRLNSWEEELGVEQRPKEGDKVSRKDILMKLDTQGNKSKRNWVRPPPKQLRCFGELKENAEDSFNKVLIEHVERKGIDPISEDILGKFKSANEYLSSPGLSDVSAESVSSSDVEKEVSRPAKKRISRSAEHFRHEGEMRGTPSEIINKTPEQQSVSSHDQVKVSPRPPNGGNNKNNARYTSLIMITGDTVGGNNNARGGVNDEQSGGNHPFSALKNARRNITNNPGKLDPKQLGVRGSGSKQVVSVVTSDTTTVVPGESRGGDFVVVSHTNRDASPVQRRGREREEEMDGDHQTQDSESVTVITGEKTLSAFEEGLADDDSWVENLSNNEETLHDDEDFGTSDDEAISSSSGDEVTLTCSAVADQEDELRGYHRAAIDFTLHTIVEESCEESEVEQNVSKNKKKQRPMSATDLEKYFFFGLGDGNIQSSINSNREDTLSETSSIYSEGMESLGNPEDPANYIENSPEDLASSRLEKYFLSGFMGFTQERRDSDGSVGSDSEGKPSPEQRRKRLVRARGAGRSHSSSLDNLLAHSELGSSEQTSENNQINSEDSSSSDSDTYDELSGFKDDGQFDTVKRKGKVKKIRASTENLEITQEMNENNISEEDDERNKTPQPELITIPSNLTTNKQQQSRDSGFVGSCDDLLKDQKDVHVSDFTIITENEKENVEIQKNEENKTIIQSVPPNTSLTRRDSFNNWSSDEETNLMMSKMRQFFKTMVAGNANKVSSQPTTPNLSTRTSPKPLPRVKTRCKPPQLVYFENELTRLMKTVPGLRDDQVKEIVEYLSSEDTWSDSYDSSDYTSSDLETASSKSALQKQISDSCKQIMNKFDNNIEDTEGDLGDGGILDENHGLNKETAFVYQKLVASFEKMATGDKPVSTTSSPPLIAKVMHHIGSRLVALMHEVSSGESHASNSPRMRHYHRRLQQKLSNASSTTTDDDSTDSNIPEAFIDKDAVNILPRSKSHDLLMSENNKHLQQSREGPDNIIEEKEMSDSERFSWRGSFESALLASDSRNRLSLISSEHSASASALAIAAKRRSAGDLLFSHKSLSREQLDRVRSCGSIGGDTPEEKLWVATATKPNRRRSSVPDSGSCGSGDGGSQDGDNEEDNQEKNENRSTLPRSLLSGPQSTNSLPRLPTNTVASIQKAQSHHFLSHNAKSARYRPPGFSRLLPTVPKRAVSAPGLQLSYQRRGRRSQPSNVPISDDVSLSEAHSSPMLATRMSKSATPSPVAPSTRRKTNSLSSHEWPAARDDDIDRLVVLHHNRSSLSSLGLRSDSMASVYSGAGEGRHGFVTVKGQVEFGLQYNYKAGDLEIQIKQCRDLAPVDTKRNRSDPYVKVYLLPDKSKSGKRKTKVKKHTLNPVFDESLKFHMTINELEIRTLWLTVWHSDMFGRNDFLGEVMMALENKVFDDPTPKWYNLQERTEPFDDILSFKGDILVALKFVPPDMTVPKKGKRSRGALHVLVKEAKALTAVKANGTSDPFVKSYLLPEKGRSSKQKTSVVKRTVNPIWNHNFIYDDVTLQELAERSLELTIWDHDRLASNEFLGGVRFSLGTGKHYGKPVEWMDATGKELNLWKSMLERPNFWVEGCLALRPTLDIRMS